jgi:cytochrome c oxidase subunit I
MLVFLVNLVYSMLIARVPAEANPWSSLGLEFQLPTPVPVKNFERTPVITSGPYEYGVPDAPPVAALGPAAAATGATPP